jgi:hypothetical protein
MTREIDIEPHRAAERRSHMLDRCIVEIAARQHGVIVVSSCSASASRDMKSPSDPCAPAPADLWELRASEARQIDVTVMSDRRGDGTVCIHRDALDPSETMARQRIRVTKPLNPDRPGKRWAMSAARTNDPPSGLPTHDDNRPLNRSSSRTQRPTRHQEDAQGADQPRRGTWANAIRPELNVKMRIGGIRLQRSNPTGPAMRLWSPPIGELFASPAAECVTTASAWQAS